MASRTLEVQENMEGIALNLLDITCKKTHSVTDRAKIKKYAVMMQNNIQKLTILRRSSLSGCIFGLYIIGILFILFI